jgi:hypothetical protein
MVDMAQEKRRFFRAVRGKVVVQRRIQIFRMENLDSTDTTLSAARVDTDICRQNADTLRRFEIRCYLAPIFGEIYVKQYQLV